MTALPADQKVIVEGVNTARKHQKRTSATKEAGLLDDCGKALPFLDKMVFNVERDKTPLRSKFTQGFLDVPEIERLLQVAVEYF